MTRKRVVVIEGEDAAPGAVRPALALIDHLGVDIEWFRPLVGRAAMEAGGSPFPDDTRAAIERAAADFPDIELQTFIVDDFARRLVSDPHELDVVVLPNLYGDILSDAAAGLVRGLGLAPSGCYGDDYAYFEAVHGTAPDLARRNVINPTATILSAAMMLDYLGCTAAAQRLEAAIAGVYADGRMLTPPSGRAGDHHGVLQRGRRMAVVRHAGVRFRASP